MELVLGIIGLIVVALGLFMPRKGLLATLRRGGQAGRRVRLEDALKHLHATEVRGVTATAESLSGALGLRLSQGVRLVAEMEGAGLVESTATGLRLTARGRDLALRVVRAHRLLERYLADEIRMPLEALHATADREEHRLSAEEVDALEARLGYPTHDPHGDPIPAADGSLPEDESTPLLDWPVGQPGEIAHVEDEPAEVFSRILAAGIRPGMHVEVLERGRDQVILWDGVRDYALTPLIAANLYLAPLPYPVRPPLHLSALAPGESGRVLGLECEGFTRRRLLDLGLTPGSRVDCCYAGPFGEPVAYRVSGALIALRPDQADEVRIERLEPEAAGESA